VLSDARKVPFCKCMVEMSLGLNAGNNEFYLSVKVEKWLG